MRIKKVPLTIFILIITISMVSCWTEAKNAGKNASPPFFDIKVITYNICALPDLITEERGLAPAKQRLPEIGKRLRKYDIIGLQEAFIRERFYVELKLGSYFLARGTDTHRKRRPGSGIYIFSK